MSLTIKSMGKWLDVSCKKPSLVVCQKKQDINIESLKNIIDGLTKSLEKQNTDLRNEMIDIRKKLSEGNLTQVLKKKVEELEEEVNTFKTSSVPIGFLYTQLPNQSSPIELWPKTNWSEVTQQYSGLFFRAEGGGSEPFGRTQSANYSKISTLEESSYDARLNQFSGPHLHEVKEGWSNLMSGPGLYALEFFTTSAENRPRNTAIKIWKRIQ